MNRRKKNNISFFHDIERRKYNNLFLKTEKKFFLPQLGSEDMLIVRLDGKGLTKKFLSNKLYSNEFFEAMKKMLSKLKKYCPYISFGYMANDEVSLIIDKKQLSSKIIDNRAEKILTYLSGFVSALFSLYINKESNSDEKAAYSFDARAVIIKKEKTKDYFVFRQNISVSYYMQKLCKEYNFQQKPYSIDEINKLLLEQCTQWDSFPKEASMGIVGYSNDNDEWTVDTAHLFSEEWDSYNKEL